jgi:hypothetical protein
MNEHDENTAELPAPRMFQRPADVPEPLPSVQHGEHVANLHRGWMALTAPSARTPRQRLLRLARRVRGRSLTSDRALIADLIRAVDAVAARCDELADRVQTQHVLLHDMASIFGEELTALRAAPADPAGRSPVASGADEADG